MDRPAPAPPSQRERVFCHPCRTEWYRDEHGLECPRCHGDFVEVIEQGNDPRAFVPEDEHDAAPDPGEDDIDQLEWQRHDAGDVPYQGFTARYERTRSQDAAQQQQQSGGWGSMLGNIFRLASDFVQPAQPAQNQNHEHEQQPPNPDNNNHSNNFTQQTIARDGSTTIVRHMNGNGYSFTMSTTRGLHPRDPMNAQPFQRQPEGINDILQLLNNIGAMSPSQSPQGHGFPIGPGFVMNPQIGNPYSPLPGLLQHLFNLPMAAVHGDAVYSQEGLDRIISQLMEQHQTGNAPGPATESAIKSLPQRSITEKDLGETGSAECSICMESVALGEKVTVLPCDHWFHYDCIEAWLSEHDTCPHCRKGIMADAGANAARSPGQAPLNDTQSAEHNRTSVPGSYPFPEQGGGSSSSSRPRGTGQGEGVFNSMREAFGGGSNNSQRQ